MTVWVAQPDYTTVPRLSETMTVAELLVNWRRASIYAFANDEFAIQAAKVPAKDNGLRRGRVGKRRLGLLDDRRLRERQQVRQLDARVRIGATNLKPIEILVRHFAGIRVQLRDECGHTRWEGLWGAGSALPPRPRAGEQPTARAASARRAPD
jgi:hypothetical protein